MLLKKQTVWLLTMLSLVVVLSVYYITSPEQKGNDITAVQQKAKDQVNTKQEQKTADKSGKTIVSQVSDETFDTIRLQLDDQRSQAKEDLQAKLASTELPADERSEAYDQMKKLNETAQKEEVLETLIKTLGYDDALVRADGDKVSITVKSKKQHTASAANDIIQLVKKEMDTNFVAVEFQPSK
jgi:stage III sporulation protein AH